LDFFQQPSSGRDLYQDFLLVVGKLIGNPKQSKRLIVGNNKSAITKSSTGSSQACDNRVKDLTMQIRMNYCTGHQNANKSGKEP